MNFRNINTKTGKCPDDATIQNEIDNLKDMMERSYVEMDNFVNKYNGALRDLRGKLKDVEDNLLNDTIDDVNISIDGMEFNVNEDYNDEVIILLALLCRKLREQLDDIVPSGELT